MAYRYVTAKRLGLAAGVLALLAASVGLYYCWFFQYHWQTTVIVLRHAEKGTHPDDDLVPLTQAGDSRARNLAEVLDRAGVTAIYVTQKVRTQQTAQYLAANQTITPTPYIYGTDTDIDNLITEVRASKNRGGVIVVVGHSDSVPKIVAKLEGAAVTVGNEFDNLFVLRLNRWSGHPAKLIKATYGEPRSCPTPSPSPPSSGR